MRKRKVGNAMHEYVYHFQEILISHYCVSFVVNIKLYAMYFPTHTAYTGWSKKRIPSFIFVIT